MPEVVLKFLLGHEDFLALVLYEDLAGGLEEAFRGPFRGQLDLVGGAPALNGYLQLCARVVRATTHSAHTPPVRFRACGLHPCAGFRLTRRGRSGHCYPSFRGEETKEDLRPAFFLLVVPSDGARAAAICYGAAPAKGRIASVMENDAAVGHVVLLGDSVFDNAAYVAGAPDVVRQVRRRLPAGVKATLAAVDGSTTRDVHGQLRRLPGDATHLVISVGGNDALGTSDFLGAPARSNAEALSGLADIGYEFERGYRAMLAEALAHGLPTAICTVYYPRFPDMALQKVAVAGLTVFNDCIVRAAFTYGIPLLDLRLICTEEADYANPIEPSERGGEKVSRAIVEFVERGPTGGRTEVFT